MFSRNCVVVICWSFVYYSESFLVFSCYIVLIFILMTPNTVVYMKILKHNCLWNPYLMTITKALQCYLYILYKLSPCNNKIPLLSCLFPFTTAVLFLYVSNCFLFAWCRISLLKLQAQHRTQQEDQSARAIMIIPLTVLHIHLHSPQWDTQATILPLTMVWSMAITTVIEKPT